MRCPLRSHRPASRAIRLHPKRQTVIWQGLEGIGLQGDSAQMSMEGALSHGKIDPGVPTRLQATDRARGGGWRQAHQPDLPRARPIGFHRPAVATAIPRERGRGLALSCPSCSMWCGPFSARDGGGTTLTGWTGCDRMRGIILGLLPQGLSDLCVETTPFPYPATRTTSLSHKRRAPGRCDCPPLGRGRKRLTLAGPL